MTQIRVVASFQLVKKFPLFVESESSVKHSPPLGIAQKNFSTVRFLTSCVFGITLCSMYQHIVVVYLEINIIVQESEFTTNIFLLNLISLCNLCTCRSDVFPFVLCG
jgi:hypothetical protein